MILNKNLSYILLVILCVILVVIRHLTYFCLVQFVLPNTDRRIVDEATRIGDEATYYKSRISDVGGTVINRIRKEGMFSENYNPGFWIHFPLYFISSVSLKQ